MPKRLEAERADGRLPQEIRFDGHFVKPIDLDALRKRIASPAAQR